MIFIRVVPFLLVTAISAQALYIPKVLYAREYEESRDVAARELSKRSLHHLNVVHDLASGDGETVLATRGNEEHKPHGHKKAEERRPAGEMKGGQKVAPRGIRLGVNSNGKSPWYAETKDGKK
jgi:hypothetical protein